MSIISLILCMEIIAFWGSGLQDVTLCCGQFNTSRRFERNWYSQIQGLVGYRRKILILSEDLQTIEFENATFLRDVGIC